jgi:hypothetical protein
VHNTCHSLSGNRVEIHVTPGLVYFTPAAGAATHARSDRFAHHINWSLWYTGSLPGLRRRTWLLAAMKS